MNEQWMRHGISLENRAQLAYNIRHEARFQARGFMSNPSEVETLQTRDMLKYQNPNGPTFEYLYNSYNSMGYSKEKIYQSIIEHSKITNPEYDAKFILR